MRSARHSGPREARRGVPQFRARSAMIGDGPSPKYGGAPIKAEAAFAPAPGAGKLRFGPATASPPSR